MILSNPTDPQFTDSGKQEDAIPLGATLGITDPQYTDDTEESEETVSWLLLSFIDQPLPDTTPPVIANVVPSSGSVDIAKDQPLSFTVTDADSGVSFTTIKIWVRGELIFNGAASNPWVDQGWGAGSSYAAIAGGYAFNLVPSRTDYFRDETVTWQVYAQDHEGNAVDQGFRFSAIRAFRFTVYKFLIEAIRSADERE